jgi:hypothetical protein
MYPHTAKPIDTTDGRYVDVANTQAKRLGWPWDWAASEDPAASHLMEQALIDTAYALDAPSRLPAGACYGVHCYEEFASAIQQEVRRS